MPSGPQARAFILLYASIGVVVLIQSIETVVAAGRGTIPAGDRLHARVLGGLEIVAAVLFLIPRTMRAGAIGLLVIFALAFGLHAVRGDFALPLLVYAAGVFFVRTHGIDRPPE
jgi:uncharacterized membrane protein YphA (DoxX/SURF4 family)